MESTKVDQNTSTKGWGAVPQAPSCSFKEVMSEELALELEKADINSATNEKDDLVWFDSENNDTNSDELLAKLLQKQFDDEQNDIISRLDNKYNGQSKITISHDKYKVKVDELDDSSDEYEDFPLWHDKVKIERTPQFNKSGVSGKGTNMITKHDADLCATKNAAKMDHFPPGMGIGDRTGVKLPNHVFNSLKVHSMSENKRANRLHEKKEHSTAEMAVDERTRLILFKLVNGGWLEELRGLLSTGKESVVLYAIGGKNQETLIPAQCAVKVFKTTLSDFKNRAIYVKGDIRFFKDEFKKQNPRKILKIWADKEAANLKRLAHNNIPCPSFVILKKHVLVMSFIGSDEGVPAPTLKDAKLTGSDVDLAWEQVRKYIKIMYRNCKIVHADLSSYNLLWKDKTVFVIDVGQAVEILHPLAHQFLLRDCQNVIKFFKDLGVDDLPSPYELFNAVTELDLKGEGEEFLQQIQEYEKKEENLRLGHSEKNFAFDFFFEKASKENKA